MTSPTHLPRILPFLAVLVPLRHSTGGSLSVAPMLWPLSLLPASLLLGLLLIQLSPPPRNLGPLASHSTLLSTHYNSPCL